MSVPCGKMANMLELPKGGNAPLPTSAVHVTLSWTVKPGAPECDLSALAVGENGKVGTDADFVFYNAASHPTGAITHRGPVRGPGTDTVEVDLAALPQHIDRVVRLRRRGTLRPGGSHAGHRQRTRRCAAGHHHH